MSDNLLGKYVTFTIKLVWCVIVVTVFYYLVFKTGHKTDDIKTLEKKSLNGIIISIKASPNGHGHYHIGIFDKIKCDSLKYNLYGHHLFSDKYKIKVGDSVSKDTNNIMLTFHNYEGKEIGRASCRERV